MWPARESRRGARKLGGRGKGGEGGTTGEGGAKGFPASSPQRTSAGPAPAPPSHVPSLGRAVPSPGAAARTTSWRRKGAGSRPAASAVGGGGGPRRRFPQELNFLTIVTLRGDGRLHPPRPVRSVDPVPSRSVTSAIGPQACGGKRSSLAGAALSYSKAALLMRRCCRWCRPVPSRPVPSRPVPSRSVPSRPVPSRPVPSRPAPSHPVPSHPVTSRPR